MNVPLADLGTRYGADILHTDHDTLANCFILTHLLTYETDPEFARQWIFKVTHHRMQVSQGYNTIHFIQRYYWHYVFQPSQGPHNKRDCFYQKIWSEESVYLMLHQFLVSMNMDLSTWLEVTTWHSCCWVPFIWRPSGGPTGDGVHKVSRTAKMVERLTSLLGKNTMQ